MKTYSIIARGERKLVYKLLTVRAVNVNHFFIGYSSIDGLTRLTSFEVIFLTTRHVCVRFVCFTVYVHTVRELNFE
jgi:hypothetical protein